MLAKIMKHIYFLTLTFLLVSCMVSKGTVEVSIRKKLKMVSLNGVSVSSVKIVNHQVIITGTNFENVTNFAIKESGVTTPMQIESKTGTTIVANTLSNVTLAAGKVFDFVLSNASAASTFTVDFSLCDSTLGTKGFDCTTVPNNNEVLTYDSVSGKWMPKAMNGGLSYQGSFDASGAAPTSNGPSAAGEYYIISVAGNGYLVGDWAVDNGTTMDRINNSTVITGVFGRTGAVVATEGDYNLDKLLDVDVTTVAPTNGQVLKYNGAQWVAGTIVTVETDPNVTAFAKAALPTCAAGEVLKGNGTSLSCVTDNTGAAAFSGTANRAVVTDGTGALAVSTITDTVLGYLSGATSNIQTQLDSKLASGTFVDWSVAGVQTLEPTRLNLTTANRVVVTSAGGVPTPSAVTTTELGYVSGVTSNIQTQIDSKAAAFTGTVDRAVITNGTTGALTVSAVTNTELGYVSGVTSAIQTQLDSKQATITAASTLDTGSITTHLQNGVNIDPYNAGAGQTGELRFYELAPGTDYTGFKAPDTLAANIIYTLPGTAPTNGQVLSSTAGGVLSWVAIPSAPVTSVNGATGVVVLTTTDVAEGTNKYHTDARVIAAPLTAYSIGTNTALTATDTVLQGMQKLEGQIASKQGTITATTAADYYRGDKTFATLDTLAVPENTNLYYTNARAIGATLTGYAAGTNTALAATDTILQGMQKLEGQVGSKLAASSFVDWSVAGVQTLEPTRLNLTTANRAVVTSAGGVPTPSAVTATELGYVSGVTSAIQTQLDGKLSSTLPTCAAGEVLKANGTVLSCVTDNTGAGAFTGTMNRVVLTDGATGALTVSAVTNTELGYVSGVTSAIQTQLDSKQATITAASTLDTGSITTHLQNGVNIDPYNAGAGQTGELRFYELAPGTDYTGFKAPDTLAANIIYTLPGTAPTNGQVLSSTAGGVLSWVAIPSAPVTSVNGATGVVVLTTSDVAEGTNKYHTDARVIAAPLTAYSIGTNTALAATDTVLQGMQKLEGQIASKQATITATTAADYYRGDKTFATLDTLAVPENTNLYYTNARAIGATLTGYAAGTNTALAATDTILQGMQKLEGQVGSKLAASSFVDWSVAGVQTLEPTRLNLTTANRAVVTSAGGVPTPSAVTATELGYLSGVTSAIQTQLDSKAGAFTGTVDRAVITNGTTGALTVSTVTNTELGYVSGVTSAIQTQLNAKQATITAASTLNTGSITTNLQNGVNLNPYNTGAGQTGEVRFYELAASGSDYTGFKAPDALAANIIYTLPGTAPTNGQVLSSTAGGVLSWIGIPAAPVTSVNGATGVVVLTTSDVAEGTNKYHTDARVIAAPLTAYSIGTNTALAATDTVLQGMQKLEGQIASKQGTITATTSADYYRGDKTFATLNTLAVPENTNLYFTNARAIAAPLTGYAIGTNTALAATDSVLQGMQKLEGQVGSKLASSSFVDWSVAGVQTLEPTRLNLTTASRAVATNASGVPVATAVTSTELGYLSGVTSSIQTQINALTNPWTASGSDIYRASGNVGIGSAASSPAKMLHVKGDQSQGIAKIERTIATTTLGAGTLQLKAHTSGDMADTFGPALMFMIGDSGLSDQIIAEIDAIRDGADNSGSIMFQTYNAGSVGERMRIKPSGDVGIGTSTPGAKLEVNGQVKITGGSPGAGKVLTSDGSGLGSWATPTTSQWTTATNDIYYSAGKVAIGTSTIASTAAMTVNGAINTNGNSIIMGVTSGDARHASTAIDIQVERGSSTQVVTNNNAVGIGSNNIVTGYHATVVGSTNTAKGNWNTVYGFTNVSNNAFDYATMFGSNNTVTDHGGIGIGTNNTAGNSAAAIGRSNVASGTSSSALGRINTSSGTQSVAVGWTNTASATGAIAVGWTSIASAAGASAFGTSVNNAIANSTQIGPSNTAKMTILSSGYVGIGTDTPTYNLHVVGTAGLSTGTAWTNASDKRLKDIHGDYEYGLDEILKLHTVRYSYKKGNPLNLPSDFNKTGFIAQEVQKVIPEAVSKRSDGFLELNVDPIHWAVVNAIKDLYKKYIEPLWKNDQKQDRAIASLSEKDVEKEERIKKLEAENAALKARLDRIEKALLAPKAKQ